jgi:hypothetical protein
MNYFVLTYYILFLSLMAVNLLIILRNKIKVDIATTYTVGLLFSFAFIIYMLFCVTYQLLYFVMKYDYDIYVNSIIQYYDYKFDYYISNIIIWFDIVLHFTLVVVFIFYILKKKRYAFILLILLLIFAFVKSPLLNIYFNKTFDIETTFSLSVLIYIILYRFRLLSFVKIETD